jgi:hypothetical protein
MLEIREPFIAHQTGPADDKQTAGRLACEDHHGTNTLFRPRSI